LRPILDGIYHVIGNYGWSIAVFTIIIRAILLPLDVKNRKGMLQMQKMQPKIQDLQKKYANDQQKLQQKQMELFKKEHYSPFSGCLPMLIQLPIFWIMFSAMRSLANEQMIQQIISYALGESPDLAGWLWVKNVWASDSPFSAIVPTVRDLTAIPWETWKTAIANLSPEIVQRLAALENFTDGTLVITNAESAQALVNALIEAAKTQPAYQAALATSMDNLNILFVINVSVYQTFNGLLILPVLAAVTQVLMNKFTNPTQQPAASDNPQAQQSQSMNNMMKYFFPILSVYFCLISSASFAIYWVTSNIVAGVSNYGINKYLDSKDKAKTVQGEVQ